MQNALFNVSELYDVYAFSPDLKYRPPISSQSSHLFIGEVLLSDLIHLCHLTSSLLKLTFVSPFQNIYNLHNSSFTGPMMTLLLAGNLINLRRSFNNSLSHYQQHSMSLDEKIKMPFANKNVPLTDCRKFSYLFFIPRKDQISF